MDFINNFFKNAKKEPETKAIKEESASDTPRPPSQKRIRLGIDILEQEAQEQESEITKLRDENLALVNDKVRLLEEKARLEEEKAKIVQDKLEVEEELKR